MLEGAVCGKPTRLWRFLSEQEPCASYVIEVPPGPHRTGRTAVMQLQYTPVTLSLFDRRRKGPIAASLWAVRAIEIGTAPTGERPIEWMLLTTVAVHSSQDAYQVVLAYALRWRIEEFHKALKSGGCRIEESQLRDRDPIER